MGGWVDRWMEAKAGLTIAYSNKKQYIQNIYKLLLVFMFDHLQVISFIY